LIVGELSASGTHQLGWHRDRLGSLEGLNGRLR
jgi:hypothetical protein